MSPTEEKIHEYKTALQGKLLSFDSVKEFEDTMVPKRRQLSLEDQLLYWAAFYLDTITLSAALDKVSIKLNIPRKAVHLNVDAVKIVGKTGSSYVKQFSCTFIISSTYFRTTYKRQQAYKIIINTPVPDPRDEDTFVNKLLTEYEWLSNSGHAFTDLMLYPSLKEWYLDFVERCRASKADPRPDLSIEDMLARIIK